MIGVMKYLIITKNLFYAPGGLAALLRGDKKIKLFEKIGEWKCLRGITRSFVMLLFY